MNYALITPARNESRTLSQTIASVVAQTRRPVRWVIVDDGSTDQTPEIAAAASRENPWIHLVRQPPRAERSFAGKAAAVRAGLERLAGIDYDVIGNLDADVTFGADYLDFVVSKFGEDPMLGVAGTPFTEAGDYDSARDSFEGDNYVAGPCQLFRRTCWEDIGGYVAHRAGGVDWIAVMTARMKGWTVRAFPERRFHHHRAMGTAERSVLHSMFTYGEKDYYLGNAPLWELFRVTYRMAKPPYLLGGLALSLGYLWAAVRRIQRPVSKELMQYHRREQMRRLRSIVRTLLRGRGVDAFRAGREEAAIRPVTPPSA